MASVVDVFVVNALPDNAAAVQLIGNLRGEKFATISSYKATKNFGKLRLEAAGSAAKLAVILAPAEFAKGMVTITNLISRDELEVPKDGVIEAIRRGMAVPEDRN